MAKRSKATVMFIDKHHNNVVKPFQIPVSFLRNWKRFVFGISGMFFLMISVIVYLLNRGQEITPQTIVRSSTPIQSQVAAKRAPVLDTSLLKSKFESIDQKMSKINSYLKAKGINPVFTNYHKNTKEGITWDALKNLVENYDRKLEQTAHFLEKIPLGFPVDGSRITSYFGGRSNPFSGYGAERHKGLDFSGNKGDAVKSTASGNVVFAGQQNGYGNVVIVKHANGFQTKYAHLSKIMVRQGADVSTGQQIGKVGSTGRSTGPHLHYEVLKNGHQINPNAFLNYE